MIREKRKQKRRVKNILKSIFIILLLAAALIFIAIKVFVVKTIKVEGNKLYDEKLIQEAVLNDEYSWNSLYVFIKYTFMDTQEIPFIDTMEIKLNGPSSLTIKVYEKGMMGYLHIPSINQMAYFDKDGFVVETSSRIIENVPKIDGITCEEVVLLEKLPIESQKLRGILTLTQALKRENLVPDSIHFGLDVSPVLYYGDTTVWLGSMELLTQKIERLHEIFPNIEGMEGVLHMENWSEETANIIFEKTEKKEDVQDIEGDDSQSKEEVQNTGDFSGNPEDNVPNKEQEE